MHPFSVLALSIFVAGYITARWDLVTRLYELAIFAWDHGVVVSLPIREEWPDLIADHRLLATAQTRSARAFAALSIFYFLLIIPINHLVTREINWVWPTALSKFRGHFLTSCF